MAREQFVNNLYQASRMLPVQGGSARADTDPYPIELWLSPKTVEGFDPANWLERARLEEEIGGFLTIANQATPEKPPTKAQCNRARKHLERAIEVVRRQLLHEWLEAQQKMIGEAAAAEAKGWYAEKDEKQLQENLLGSYKAPRLRIRTRDREVVLDPIARFGSGRQGIVDLVVLPTYETACFVVYKDDRWQIVAANGAGNAKPFTKTALVNAINRLSHS